MAILVREQVVHREDEATPSRLELCERTFDLCGLSFGERSLDPDDRAQPVQVECGRFTHMPGTRGEQAGNIGDGLS